MTKSEVQTYMQAHKIHLDTSQGQHFLISDEVLHAIIETANIQDKDRVIEIGPGIGVLTKELVRRAKEVIAIEIDAHFVLHIHAFAGNPKNLTVIEGNALHTDMPTDAPYKIVANIPYHITSPLLHRFLLEEPLRPTSMTLLIQKEVAENICSEGTASILTLLVQLYGTPSLVYRVPPTCFVPPPKVDSAVLHIELYPEPKGTPELREKAMMLLKHANKERRKMLRNTVAYLPGGKAAMAKANIEQTRRPQTLTADEWLGLAEAFLFFA